MTFEDEAMRALLPLAEREILAAAAPALREMCAELGMTQGEADGFVDAVLNARPSKFLAAAEQYARSEFHLHLMRRLVDASGARGDVSPLLQRLHDADECNPQ